MANITVYTTETCGYCKMLMGYLQSKDIPFEKKQADMDPALAKELLEKSGQLGVPFTIIEKDGEERKILGFDRQQIDEVLGIS